MRQRLASAYLRLLGLPRLDRPSFDERTEAELESAADRLLVRDQHSVDELPVPRIEFLRWLAERRDVLFHGSSRDDLHVLEPIRHSRDTTVFGDQQAVYATSDPVWAVFFATVRRCRPFSTRNASLGVAGSTIYPRWYFFSLGRNQGPPPSQFGAGSLYVLPRAGFVPQSPLGGLVETAQWVSTTAVEPLLRLDVDASDFVFRDVVVMHSAREPTFVTMLKARRRGRRR